MADTVFLEIHYDSDPPFSKKVRYNVEEIFKKCFKTLENDTVVIKLTKGTAEKKDLGPKAGPPRSHHVNLKSGFDGTCAGTQGNLGISGGNESDTCPASVQAAVDETNRTDSGGDIEIATANNVAHELGFHVLAGESDPAKETKGDDIVDRKSITKKLCKELGKWSPDVCNAMKKTLKVS